MEISDISVLSVCFPLPFHRTLILKFVSCRGHSRECVANGFHIFIKVPKMGGLPIVIPFLPFEISSIILKKLYIYIYKFL
jgi:hypothetical protein